MNDFAMAQAADGEAHALAEDCAAQLSGAGDHNIGFLYVTNRLAGALDDIVNILKTRSSVSNWFGTVGIGICATGTEYFDRPAIVALTGRFADDASRTIPSLTIPNDINSKFNDGFAAAIGVVHGDPRNPQTTDIVSAFARAHEVFLVGGLSSAESSFPQVAGKITDGGVSGVLLGGKLEVAIGLTQGCSPIGTPHEVTGGEGNVLMSLDDRSAFEVLCEDAGVEHGVDPLRALANVHAALLVAGSDTGDYLVRNLSGIDPTRGLVEIAEDVSTANRLMFVRRDAENAAKDLQRMLNDLQSRMSGPPKAGLYFSCVARGPNLFPGEAYELNAIRDAFGDIPIVGFFGNGEISHDRVYGYTGVLALFL